jgi:hypothetical protein
MKTKRFFITLVLAIAFAMPGLATAHVESSPGYADYQIAVPDALNDQLTATLDLGGGSDPFWIGEAQASMDISMLGSFNDTVVWRPSSSNSYTDMRLGEAAAGVTRRHWYIDH